MKYLVVVLLLCKLPFAANDGVLAFKFIDKGLKEEDMGLFV
jgi:hypothetical protein